MPKVGRWCDADINYEREKALNLFGGSNNTFAIYLVKKEKKSGVVEKGRRRKVVEENKGGKQGRCNISCKTW